MYSVSNFLLTSVVYHTPGDVEVNVSSLNPTLSKFTLDNFDGRIVDLSKIGQEAAFPERVFLGRTVCVDNHQYILLP